MRQRAAPVSLGCSQAALPGTRRSPLQPPRPWPRQVQAQASHTCGWGARAPPSNTPAWPRGPRALCSWAHSPGSGCPLRRVQSTVQAGVASSGLPGHAGHAPASPVHCAHTAVAMEMPVLSWHIWVSALGPLPAQPFCNPPGHASYAILQGRSVPGRWGGSGLLRPHSPQPVSSSVCSWGTAGRGPRREGRNCVPRSGRAP